MKRFSTDFIDPHLLEKTIVESFGRKYSRLIQSNLATFRKGFERVIIEEYPFDGRFESLPFRRPVPEFGYRTAPLGGAILNRGNTVSKDLSASRQGIFPRYHRDRCIDCGLCTMTCPDFVFVWNPGIDKKGLSAMVLEGPNYQYCKGCLKCVEICPVEALTLECERPEFRFTADVQLWGPRMLS